MTAVDTTPRPGTPLPESQDLGSRLASRDNNFDFLRLAAAFVVIISHYYALRDGDNDREPYFRLSGYCNLGKLAVYAYFVISGLLVTRALLANPCPRRYLWRRAARIFPALWVCVAFCILVVGPRFTNLGLRAYLFHKETAKFAGNAVLYPNHYTLPGVFTQFVSTDPRAAINGSLWSVPAGFLMYLGLLALGVTGLLQRKSWLIAMTLAMLLGWLAYATLGIPETSRLYKHRVWIEFLPHLGFFFLCGALIALYGKLSWLNVWWFLACAAAVRLSWGHAKVGYLVLTLCLPYMVFYLGFARFALVGSAIRSMNRFGDFSYGVYLYGYPVQQVFMRTWGARLSTWEHIVLACVASLLLAMLSWHVIERSALRRA